MEKQAYSDRMRMDLLNNRPSVETVKPTPEDIKKGVDILEQALCQINALRHTMTCEESSSKDYLVYYALNQIGWLVDFGRGKITGHGPDICGNHEAWML